MRVSSLLLALLLAAPAAPAQSPDEHLPEREAPQRLAYTGLLTDDAGEPVPDGAYTLTFRLYATADASGTPVWTGTREVTASGGRFSTLLDAAVPEGSASGGAGGYLTIQVGDAPASVPVALSASGSSAAGGSLQDAYNAGNQIGLTGQAVTINGTAGQIAMRINDGDLFFNNNFGTAVQRFRSGQTGQVWQLRAYGAPPTGEYSRFALRDVTGGGNEPFTVEPGAADGLLTLTESLLLVGQRSTAPNPTSGQITWYRATSPSMAGTLGSDYLGGSLRLRNASGTREVVRLGGNWASGDGGRLYIDGGEGSQTSNGWAVLSGSQSSTGSPSLSLIGDQTIGLRTDITGDDSAMLPQSAISAPEIADEPGIVTTAVTSLYDVSGNANVIAFQTIVCPAAGQVVALASYQLFLASGERIEVGLSDNQGGFAANQDFDTSQAGLTSTSTHGVFPCSGGPMTIYLLADAVDGTPEVGERHLTLLYVPTTYGMVNSPSELSGPEGAASEGPYRLPTAADIAAEQAASVAANQARIDAEMAAMRETMQRMQRALDTERTAREALERQVRDRDD